MIRPTFLHVSAAPAPLTPILPVPQSNEEKENHRSRAIRAISYHFDPVDNRETRSLSRETHNLDLWTPVISLENVDGFPNVPTLNTLGSFKLCSMESTLHNETAKNLKKLRTSKDLANVKFILHFAPPQSHKVKTNSPPLSLPIHKQIYTQKRSLRKWAILLSHFPPPPSNGYPME